MGGRHVARLCALSFLALGAIASEAQQVEWTFSVNASTKLSAALHPLASDSSGNAFVVGSSYDGTRFSIVTVKLTPDGGEAWRATLVSDDQAVPYAIATDAAGNVVVAAAVVPLGPTSPSNGYLIVKYDAGGNELWRRNANVSPLRNATPFAIAVDTAGSTYVTGGSSCAPPTCDYHLGDFFTLKYAADGTEVWRAVTDSPFHLQDVAHAIALDGAGNVYVVGRSFYPLNPTEAWAVGTIAKYDAGGTLQWSSVVSHGGPLDDGVDVATDGAGNAYVASTSSTGDLILTVWPVLQLSKFDSKGSKLWSVDATAPVFGLVGEASRAHELVVDPAGNAYVTGEYLQVLGINTRRTFLTLKYSAAGVEQWRAIDSANLAMASNFAAGLVVNGIDDVVVAGQRADNGPGTTMKLGAGGTMDWTVEQPAFTPAAIARGHAGSVYVAGATATGIMVQKIVGHAISPAAAEVPTTSRGALFLLVLTIMVLAARRGALPSRFWLRRR